MTYFKQIVHRFPLPRQNGDIPTERFLAACTNFRTFAEFLGPVLSRAKNAINRNLQVLTEKYEQDRLTFNSLQSILIDEIKSHAQPLTLEDGCCVALIWLKRALEFVYHFLYRLSNSPDTGLSDDAYFSYELSLKPYHGYIIRGLVYMLVNIAPSKENFFLTLQQDAEGGHDELMKDIALFIEPLGENIIIINSFIEQHNLYDQTIV